MISSSSTQQAMCKRSVVYDFSLFQINSFQTYFLNIGINFCLGKKIIHACKVLLNVCTVFLGNTQSGIKKVFFYTIPKTPIKT